MDVAAAAGFVGGILQVVFDKYYGSKLEQWAARSGLQDDACNLKTQLRMAHAVLEIVGRVKPVHKDALSDLIKELKLAAYGADDALDEMDYYRLKELVESTRGGTNNPDGASSSAVQMVVRRSCYVLSNPFKRARTSIDSVMQGQEAVQPNFDRDAMSARIRSISAHLEKTADKVQKIVKLEKLVSMAAHPQPEEVNLRQTSSFLTEPNVFGRDEEINSIINMVLSKRLESRYKNFSVLPIVGIGGVGKTTLAQAVYNHPKVVHSFRVRAWACVSDTLDVTKVTDDILDSIKAGESHEIDRLSSLDAVQKNLKGKIEGKRFFIVLDDVWVNNWDKLCAPFSSGESGSMVVVTTRDQKIAEVMGSFDSVTLHGLQDDEFWSFFKQCANITEENNLAHIGRTIAKKLHGIPLAAKTMGRLLSRSHNEERWRSFLNSSNMWEVRQDPDDIMPVLRLSFQHLPPSLQCCFAYCAVFPKGYKISEQQLIFGWMAQGFIQKPREDEILEDIAKEYLNELLWCSFFEKVDGSHYMMHDLLHDLARLVSEGECWVTNYKPIPAEVCHLFVSGRLHALDIGLYDPRHGLLSDRGSLSRGLLHLERLKTLILTEVPIAVRNDWPTTIRSLCLPNITRKEQLVAVTNLKHLRYLDINSSDLEELPEEICKLYHLQVLNIKGWQHLRQLPPSMSNLVNLRHLLADEGRNFLASIPNVGNLTSLLELDMFCIGKTRGFDIAQLKDLRNLTRLKIGNLENVGNSGETSEARLNSKRRLTELSFSWSTNSYRQMSPSAEVVLEGLQPHPNIVSLHVKGYTGITSPTWLADKLTLTSLESLYLEDFSGLDFLPPLGQLPNLRKLHITKMGAITIIGLGFYGDGQVKGFPRLEEMLISNMPEWTEWVGVEHICFFPALRSLIIQHCPKLNGLQVLCFSEKQWFPQLTRLEIKGCPEVVSFPCLKHSPSVLRIQENGSILMKLDHQELCITGYKVFSSSFTVWSASKLYCTHLVSLYLEDCLEVEVLPPLGSLPHLRELHMIRMDALRRLGSEFYGSGRTMGFPCLNELSIKYLPEWRDWNEGGHFDLFPHLESLKIDNCPELNRVPCILARRENLRWFPSLNSLEIQCCPKSITFDLLFPQLPQFVNVDFVGQSYLISLGNNMFKINERGFTKSIPRTTDTKHWINSKLASAEQVDISGSSVTDELLSDIFACHICPSLLTISGCERISTLDLSHLESLESLEIYVCDSIRHLSGLQAFIALKKLSVHCVPGFLEAWNSLLESGQTQQEKFSTSLEYLEIDTASFLTSSFCSSLTSLKKLQLMDDDIKSFSEQQEQALTLLASLESFTISGGSGKLLALPGALHEVSTLKRLKVNNCPSIKFVGTCFHKFAALEVLSVRAVPNFAEAWKMQVEAEGMHMEQINASLQVLEIDDFKILNLPVCKLLTNLHKLVIIEDDRVAHISEEQGQALLLLSLQKLEFTRCYRLKALPNVLHRMLTLKELKITYCRTVNSLPDDGLPASLERLTIRACRNLYDKCLEHGTERHKITHISEIVLEW